MKALAYSRYGSPEELRIVDLPEPSPRPGELRVAVRAVSLNGSDAEFLSGRPLYARLNGLFRPSNGVLGSDLAGVVDAVGAGVQGFEVGDTVVGDIFDQRRALAERVCAPASLFVKKPADVSFEDAAAVPQAGVLGLQAIEAFAPSEGQRLLVLGAGGGVGTFAVQFAKARGAHVTAVDAAAKLPGLHALGADVALDYRREDPLADGARYDFVLDTPGRGAVRPFVRRLNPGGHYAVVGGKTFTLLAAALLGLLTPGRTVGLLIWKREAAAVQALLRAVAEGSIEPVIGARFPLEDGVAAFRALRDQAVCGKVVVTVGSDR